MKTYFVAPVHQQAIPKLNQPLASVRRWAVCSVEHLGQIPRVESVWDYKPVADAIAEAKR